MMQALPMYTLREPSAAGGSSASAREPTSLRYDEDAMPWR